MRTWKTGWVTLLTILLVLPAAWPALAGVGRLASIPTLTPTPTDTVQPWDDIYVNQHGRNVGADPADSFVRGNDIYAAYYSSDDGKRYLARSTDAGRSWLPELVMPFVGIGQDDVVFHVVGDTQPPAIYMIHNSNAILWLVASTDGGQSWSEPYLVCDDQPEGMGIPQLVVDEQGTLYAWWFANMNHRFLSYSTDGGQHWSPPVQVDHGYTPMGGMGRVVPFGGRLYFVDSGFFPLGRNHIWLFHSDDRGQSWSTPVQVDAWWYHGGGPIMAVDRAGVIYVAWGVQRETVPDQEDRRTLPYLARSTDGGLTWSLPVRLDDAYYCPMPLASGSAVVNLVVDDATATLHAILSDSRHSCFHYGSWQQDLFYTYSTDGGVTWSRNVQLNDPVEEDACYGSSLSVRGDQLFTTFGGNSPGILYAQYFLDIHEQPLPPRTMTPTPIPSPTATSTPTAGPSATATGTPTASPTATRTPVSGATPTATVMPSARPSETPTVTPSPTPRREWRLYLPEVLRR